MATAIAVAVAPTMATPLETTESIVYKILISDRSYVEWNLYDALSLNYSRVIHLNVIQLIQKVISQSINQLI